MRNVAYYVQRGSTIRPERQRVKVEYSPVAEFVEHGKTGGRQEWPQLEAAIRKTRKVAGKLVIAKIGRLRWNVAFLRLIHGVPFVCADAPWINEETIDMLTALAQNKAQRASQVAKDTPRRVKGFSSRTRKHDPRFKKGVQKGGLNSAKLRTARAAGLYDLLLPKIRQLRAEGKTLEQVAAALNEDGHRTTVGTPFNGPTLCRIIQRC